MDKNLLDTINSIQFKEVSVGYRTVTIFPSMSNKLRSSEY